MPAAEARVDMVEGCTIIDGNDDDLRKMVGVIYGVLDVDNVSI